LKRWRIILVLVLAVVLLGGAFFFAGAFIGYVRGFMMASVVSAPIDGTANLILLNELIRGGDLSSAKDFLEGQLDLTIVAHSRTARTTRPIYDLFGYGRRENELSVMRRVFAYRRENPSDSEIEHFRKLTEELVRCAKLMPNANGAVIDFPVLVSCYSEAGAVSRDDAPADLQQETVGASGSLDVN